MSYSRIIYGGRGNSFGLMRYFRAIMLIESLTNYVKTKLSQKYYKGTDDPLYFPYINHDLKNCHKVTMSTYYGGTTAGKIYIDEFITANDIFDKIKMTKEYYGNFNYETHKEIEEYNKKLRDGELKGTFIFDEFVSNSNGANKK